VVPRAIAFDLDGTLIDSRKDIAAACNHVLVWAGRAPLPEDRIATFVGDGARSLLARAFDLPRESAELDPIVAEWAAYYAAHPVDHTRWMPGAERALAELPFRGVRVGLVTNKARVVTLSILEALGAAARFDAIYAGGDGPLKPSGEAIVHVCRAMGVRPDEAWVVGDGVQDVEAARAAGARAIAISGGFQSEERLRSAAPDAIFPTLDAMMSAFTFERSAEGRVTFEGSAAAPLEHPSRNK
jgi:phosphoglycolate phosphatase